MDGENQFLVGSVGSSDHIEDHDVLDPFVPEEQDSRPKIILMGLGGSGKSSIKKVVFHKMSPNETFFIESTTKPSRENICSSSFVNFTIFEVPGQVDIIREKQYDRSKMMMFSGKHDKKALIFVIDAVTDHTEAVKMLKTAICETQKISSNIHYEIFIHKVDGLVGDAKLEEQDRIIHRLHDEIANYEELHISYYLTSIYDHSIFEAFSKVVQKLIEELPTLEALLNIYVQYSGLEKAFLCDVGSKIYVATDHSPIHEQAYELCCDMIDLVVDLTAIYGKDTSNSGSTPSDKLIITPCDELMSSEIKMSNDTILYLRGVNQYLALVCIARTDCFDKKGIVDFNFKQFKTGIAKVFELRRKRPRA